MSFLIKIFFAAIVFVIVGSISFIAVKDVTIPQEQVTETVSDDLYSP
ncbi:MAG: hypothetical protein ACRBDL_09545 [Alphaproteobacteria bacterium]